MPSLNGNYINNALLGFINRGWDLDALLNSAGINPAQFQTPNSKLSREQAVRLIKAVWKTTNDEFMGLTENPCKLGVFALMVRSSYQYKTLDRFAQNAFHFYDLFTDDIKSELIKDGDNVHIRFHIAKPELDAQHFMSEFFLLIWHRTFSWLIDYKIPLIKAQFDYSQPDHIKIYDHLFPCELTFDHPYTQITFDASFLNHRIARTSKEVDEFLKDSPANLITIPGENRTTTKKVLAFLMPDVRQKGVLVFPKFEIVAGELGTTVQTLRRRLKREGSSYQKIKDNIRKDLAIHLLKKESMSIQAVAQELGFAEPASFSKAFKLWVGCSPSNYLKEHS
jgi:AraC-like DNA-binding protein